MVHQEMFTLFSKCSLEQKNRTKRDADDNKQASMTMNKGEGISHTPLYGISRGFAKTSRSTCRNICRHRGVRAETYVGYVQITRSVRAKWERGYGPRPPRWGLFFLFFSFGLSTEVPKLTHYGVVLFHPRA